MESTHLHKGIPLLVICGPTASGKSQLAIDLARELDGEVISADSMQIYRQMNIGTAKLTRWEMDGVPHHLLDIVDPGEDFSLVDYLEAARQKVAEVAERKKLPVVAGGTGLYISSLVDNIQFEPIPADPALREKLEEQCRREGERALWDRLHTCDPELAARLHPNNRGRVIRALEVFMITGTPMSELQRRSRQVPSPYRLCMLGITFRERETLYRRIDERVDRMMEAGLLEEVRLLHRGRLSKTASQAIGYKELFDHLQGRETLAAAVEQIKLQSRRYAKRQLTWLRKDSRVRWLEWETFGTYDRLLAAAREAAGEALVQE